MRTIHSTILLCVAFMMAACIEVRAQALTEEQLIIGLGKPSPAVIAIDPAALIAEVRANAGKGIGGLPSWSQLAQLTQFNVEINFEYDSVAMVPESYRTIGLLADALHHPLLLGHRFLIVGHTDSTGKPSYNIDLSLKRAEAIREALVTTFAVPANRLLAVGVGSELPLDAANPKAAVNRRVQLINVGAVK